MAELPTPHSIAVGTLLLLYYDPNSTLIALDSWQRDDDDNDDNDDDIDVDMDGMAFDRLPESDAEWRVRLMSLLSDIVLNEDGGYVVLDHPASSYDCFECDDDKFYNEEDDDDNDDVDDDDDDVECHDDRPDDDGRGHGSSEWEHRMMDKNDGGDIGMRGRRRRQCGNGTLSFSSSSNNSSIGMADRPPVRGDDFDWILDDGGIGVDFLPPDRTRRRNDVVAPRDASYLFVGGGAGGGGGGGGGIGSGGCSARRMLPRLDPIHAGSLGYCATNLSTLLDRIDDAYYVCATRPGGGTISGKGGGGSGSSGSGIGRGRGRRGTTTTRRRSPPSLALLSALIESSASVDHLMNLLDSWHALLGGTYVGRGSGPARRRDIGDERTTTNDDDDDDEYGMMISIDGESSFGVYLRRLCLGMEEIPFEALGRLWDALRGYISEGGTSHSSSSSSSHSPSGRRRRRQRRQGGGKDDGTMNDVGGNYGANGDDGGVDYRRYNGTSSSCGDWLPSTPQIERIVRNACIDRDFDALVSKEMPTISSFSSSLSLSSAAPPRHRRRPSRRRGSHDLLETHPECPSIHFLLFLSSVACGYRTKALESLHRYFDYAMIHERKERAERALMMQACAAAGSEGGAIATSGIMGTLASGMGGITGGMTGGIMHQQQQHQQQLRAGGAGGGGGNQTSGKIPKESNVMQYAAILLAQTYYRFGYARLSLQATEEAIRIAQQSGDVECVCFANSWMAFVSSTLGGYSDTGGGARGDTSVFAKIGGVDAVVGGGGVLTRNMNFRPLAPSPSYIVGRRRRLDEDEAMLLRCRARASERGLSSLAAHASLELARKLTYRRYDTGSDGLSDNGGESSYGRISSLAWDSIECAGRMPAVGSGGSLSTTTGHGRVGHLSHHHRGVSGSMLSLGQPGPTDIYNMFPSDAARILGRQNIAIAGLWESTGHKSLASLSFYAAIFGPGGGGSNGGNEKMNSTAISGVLTSFAHGPGLDVWQSMRSTDRHRRGEVYAAILNRLILLGDSEWIASSSVPTSTLHEWSVRSCDLSLAQGMNTLLANRASFPCPGAFPAESALTFFMQSTHLCRQRGEYDKAKLYARRACWLANRHGLSFQHGWNLLQLALTDLESAPTRAPERALSPLLECLELSERKSMDSLRALALSTLAKVFLYIGGEGGGVQRCQKARAVIRAAMPLVMQHGHVWFQGEAFLNLAKCYLAEATAKEKSISSENGGDCGGKDMRSQLDSIVVELRRSALTELKKAGVHFEKIEDIQRLRQVYYLQARVCHVLPNARKKRDYFAKMFIELSLEVR